MSAGRTDPAGRGVRLTTLRCAPMTGPRVHVWEVRPAKAEEIDAAWLLPIFKFPAPCGTRRVTSSKPPLRPTLCSRLKPKKGASWCYSLFLQGQRWKKNITSVLQTACHEHKPPWQKTVSRPAGVSLIFWILSSCDGREVGTAQGNTLQL